MTYDLIITTVRDRADLLEATLVRMLSNLLPLPDMILVHEDVRPGIEVPENATLLALGRVSTEYCIPYRIITTDPAEGLGFAMLRLLRESTSPIVFYTQEDFEFLREVPVGATIDLMVRHGLNQVRFNKRDTLAIKGEDRPPSEQFRKMVREFDGQPLTSSDHWYFQAALCRRSIALEGFEAICAVAREMGMQTVERCEVKFNRWLNQRLGGNITISDPVARIDAIRTLIWGGIGERAFVRHTGRMRHSQGWAESLAVTA